MIPVDILKNNSWLDECLAHFHRQMVDYMIEQEMYDKAEEVTVSLMASLKVHPDNYIQLDTIDRCRLKKCQEVPVRPYNQTLDYALEKYALGYTLRQADKSVLKQERETESNFF